MMHPRYYLTLIARSVHAETVSVHQHEETKNNRQEHGSAMYEYLQAFPGCVWCRSPVSLPYTSLSGPEAQAHSRRLNDRNLVKSQSPMSPLHMSPHGRLERDHFGFSFSISEDELRFCTPVSAVIRWSVGAIASTSPNLLR